MTKFFRILLVLSATVLAASACIRRDLGDPNELVKIRVQVDIQAISNITTNVYNEKIPAPSLNTDMMRVMVYDPSSKNVVTQSFISNKTYNENGEQVFNGTLNIGFGNFDVLVYNFDTPTTQVRQESNEMSALAYTNPIPEVQQSKYMASKAQRDIAGNFSINYEPDHFVVARERNLRISPRDTVVVIETTAKTIIDTYYLQIHVEGMQFASSATAVISGLSPSNHFGLNERTEDPTAGVCFDLLKSTDERYAGANKDVLCAVFNTFGKIEDVASDLIVTFNVTDTAGNLLQYDFDLNTVFKTKEAIEYHWLLIDDTITIPDPGPGPAQGGGGFQPKVDDWEEEQGEIVL